MKKLMNLIAVALCAICAQAVEFDYEVNWDGTITLRDVRGSVPADLVIPAEIDGRAVIGIGAKFCEKSDTLMSVKFPGSIRAVADHCFDECNKLRSVYLNEGLLEIGKRAFCECPIEMLELPSTLESVGQGAFTRSNIPGPLFSKSTSGLKSISIRHGDNSRFEACGGNGLYDKQEKRLILVSPYATSFRVPDGCEFIGHTALLCCGNLTSIAFPDSLTEIEDEAFAACVKLTNLDFSKTKLKRVSEQAFCGCIDLISVSFPDTLVEIGGGTFCGANKLQSVSFLGNAPYVNVDYEETSGKWGDLYVAIRNFKSGDNWVYDGYIKTVSTYVKEGTSGWGEVPGTWQHRPIQYIGSPVTPLVEPFYGPFVPGEKVSLTIPALIGYTAKKLPSGLKLNKKTGEIAGAAKKPTGEAGVTVTFTKKNGPTLTAQFVVGPIPTISVTLEGDTEKCKVTGSGDHLVGKKVSLQAKSPKGTAFVGWFRDGEPWPSVEESKKTKLSYVMTKESVSLVATFEKEKMSVACPALASASFTVGVAGAAAGIPIEIETQSGVKSVAVSKLPSGMKYDKKTGLIVGAPTKAGTFNVTIKVTAKSGAVEAITVPIIVAALPDWATGTFGGMIGRFVGPIDDDEFRPYGMITMKITAAGKISAKVTAGGKTYSFSAKGFDSVDEDGDYHFRMATKKGEVYEGEISAAYHDVAKLVQVEGADDPEGSFTIAGREPYFAIVWRNEHGKDGRLSVDPTGKAQKVMDAIKDFKTVELAQFDPAYGSVVLKIDAKGTTKLSGETADGVKISGTSFLMLDDDWYHVISDMVFYDKQSGNVYDVTLCFQPVFDGSGNVVDWDWKCCDHSLRVYPFE